MDAKNKAFINSDLCLKDVLDKTSEELLSIPSKKIILNGERGTGRSLVLEDCEDLGIKNSVIFTDFIPLEYLPLFYNACEFLIYPSFYEGFGMTAVEMMGKCVPTIVAKTTAMPEVTQGLCRYYEPAENADALAAVLAEELEHPMTEMQLAEIAATMKETYDYVNIAKEYWSYIQSTFK